MADQRDPDREDLHPHTPDTSALRRRVLLTALVALVLYVASVVLLDALRAPSLYAFLAAALIYVFVVRPMMAPVREAVKLRRRLAFQAWADSREDDADGPAGRPPR
jgi:hypothetical protein